MDWWTRIVERTTRPRAQREQPRPDDAGSTAGRRPRRDSEWEALPPLQRSFADAEPTAPLETFTKGLASRQSPMMIGRMEHIVRANAPSGVATGLVAPNHPLRMEQGADLVLPAKPPVRRSASKAAPFLQRLPAIGSHAPQVAPATSHVDQPSPVVKAPESTASTQPPLAVPAGEQAGPAADVSHEIAADLMHEVTASPEPQVSPTLSVPTSTIQRTTRAPETSPLPPTAPRQLSVARRVTPTIDPALPETERRPLPVVSRLIEPVAEADPATALVGHIDLDDLPRQDGTTEGVDHSQSASAAKATVSLPTPGATPTEVEARPLATSRGDQRSDMAPTLTTAQRSALDPAADIPETTSPSPSPAPLKRVPQQHVHSAASVQRSDVAHPLAPTTPVEDTPGSDPHLSAESSVAPLPALAAPVISRSVPASPNDVTEPISPIGRRHTADQDFHHEASAATASPDVVPVLPLDLLRELPHVGATTPGQPANAATDTGTGRQMPLQRVTRSWHHQSHPTARVNPTATTGEPAVTVTRSTERPIPVQQALAQTESHALASSATARPESSPVRVGSPLRSVSRQTPVQRTMPTSMPDHPSNGARGRNPGQPASAPRALPLAQMFSASVPAQGGHENSSAPEAHFTQRGSTTVVQRQDPLESVAPLTTSAASGETFADAVAERAAAAGTTSSSARPELPASGASPADIDELARRLFDPLSARLRSELWLDRERAGLSIELRR